METRSDIVIRSKPATPIAVLTIASTLLLTTLAPAAPAPFVPEDYQNPKAQARSVAQLVPQALLLTTLAEQPPSEDPLPFSLFDWPVPERSSRPILFVDQRPFETIVGDPPFRQDYWPTPPALKRLVVSSETILGTNDQAVAPEPEPEPTPLLPYDWKLPIGKARPTREQAIQNLLESTLAPAPNEKPFSQADWPIVRRPKRAVDHHVEFYVLDQSAPFAQTDWPNPAPTPVSRERLTHLSSRLLTIEEPPKPFLQSAWPTPPALKRPEFRGVTQFRSLTSADVVDDTPQSLSDFPTPPRVTRSVALLSWTVNLQQTTLAVSDRPFFPVAFPNPVAKRRAVDLVTARDVRRTYLTDDYPFVETEWPNPVRLAKRSTETWTQNLLQTTLAIQQATFVPSDRPNPAPRRYPTHSWLVNLQQTTLAPEPSPFVQSDWPVFLAKPPAVDLRTWLQARPFYAQDLYPANEHRWPVPQPMKRPEGLGWIAQPQLGILGFPATCDVVVRVRPDVGIVRVRPDIDTVRPT